MSEPVPFTPRPRAARRHAPSFDADNFLRELDVIAHRVERGAAVPVEALHGDHPASRVPGTRRVRVLHGCPNLLREARLAHNSQHSGALGVPKHGRPAPEDGRHSQRARHDRAPARRGLTRIGTALTDRL